MTKKLKILNVPVIADIYLTENEARDVWKMQQVSDVFDEKTLNTAIDQYITMCILRKMMCN